MKIGSLVICIDDRYESCYYPFGTPIKGVVYTVRDIIDGGIWLKEIVNPIHPDCIDNQEPNFWAKHFREIEFPTAITEQIQECLTRELVEI
jgi:hypothetical protein